MKLRYAIGKTMTLLEAIKLELDTLPEEVLLSVREFVSLQKCPSEETTKSGSPWASMLSVAGTSPDFMADYERPHEFDHRVFEQ